MAHTNNTNDVIDQYTKEKRRALTALEDLSLLVETDAVSTGQITRRKLTQMKDLAIALEAAYKSHGGGYMWEPQDWARDMASEALGIDLRHVTIKPAARMEE